MFEVAHKRFGAIDVVCPGAGVFEPPSSAFWHPPGQPPSGDDPQGGRYTSLDINLTHPIRVTQLAISYFLSASPKVSTSNPKSIIHLSSIAGELSSLPLPLYHASKHAIMGFVRSFAGLENTLGIRVAAVAPGIIKTPLWTKEKLKLIKGQDEWVPPEDVAEVMVNLVEKNEISSTFGADAPPGENITLGGGSVIEITKGRVRDVPMFNNTGPSGQAGSTVSGMGDVTQEVYDMLKVEGWGKSS